MHITNTAWERTNSNLWSDLRALPSAAWILFFGMFLNKFGAFVVPFLALYLTHSGYTLAAAGLAIGAYGVGNFVASLLGGHLADTIGRRKTILLPCLTLPQASWKSLIMDDTRYKRRRNMFSPSPRPSEEQRYLFLVQD